ncbi:SNF2-related protein [Enterobacter hormaechei subsp. hoffmannii]|nr:SNF2-related protein [Enterobacter hormaechei subsp. hoffmannii]
MANTVLDHLNRAGSLDEIVTLILRLRKSRAVAQFGIVKEEGVSIQRARRAANNAAMRLLQELPENMDGNKLTDEQRQVLAGYTGEGGLTDGGSQYEYYTPQFMAEGIWDLMADYGVTSGHVLEPSAATGIFQETKPQGAIMTAAEISPVSGRINQLLHPEDDVRMGAFEDLAANVGDDTYDHAVGNIPFGESRTGYAERDPAYKGETNVGHYFVLRTIDKVKPGGLVVLVVPNGMTDGGGTNKKLRDKVARRAEFLGAHRMPSGTFAESGTATVVDVWVLRKHTRALAEIVSNADDKTLTAAHVLWPTFLKGKWFATEGKRFVHGETERSSFNNILTVKKDGRVTNEGMKQALSRRFDSRIAWEMLDVNQDAYKGANEGDKRLVGGIWHVYDGETWVRDSTTDRSGIDAERFGAQTFGDLQTKCRSLHGLLSLSASQLAAIADVYPALLTDRQHNVMTFARQQKPSQRERALRGALIGLTINDAQDLIAQGNDAGPLLADAARMVEQEIAVYGSPNGLRLAGLSDPAAKGWLTFQGNVTRDSKLSDLLTGRLNTESVSPVDTGNPEQVVAHLFSQIDLVPVSLEQFRDYCTAQLPSSDDALLDYLANFPEIALDGYGNILPMSRATSGNVRGKMTTLAAQIAGLQDGPQKQNLVRQMMLIDEKRNPVPIDKITVNLNARWLDRRLIKEFLAEQGYDAFKYTQDIQVEDGFLVSPDDYAGKDGVFSGYKLRTVTSKGVTEFKQANNSDGFLNQLENYLNGVKPRGVNAAQYLDRIGKLEASFNDWLKSHPDVTGVENDYNDAFNNYVPFEHSSESLSLEGISGKRIPLSYQNSEVRRLSEDGRGIMGFGTGLGKTTTALALEAFNFQHGRSKRTAIVVPKAVYQNWYHEARDFYGDAAFSQMLFIGLDEVMGDNGIQQSQVRNENNEPVTDSDGNPVMRNVLKDADTATILERLNRIPASNYRSVIMTKEQFGMIPMRPETIEENSAQALYNAVDMGRTDLMKSTHRAELAKNKLKDKAADTGTEKKQQVPYFEDMNFDNVIADEGHNYRNSLSAGRETAQLAYLPNPAVSQIARDMSVKSAWLMKKYNGRGVTLLTATPLVNSPLDAFNMLSHVVPVEDWKAMGILTPDDFVRVFGETANVVVQKISGELMDKQGLVGFKNLDGLRGIFHRWTTLKTAADVKESVKIPDLNEKNVEVPLTDEQKELYEALRKRASLIGQKEIITKNEDGTVTVEQNKDDDFIFSVIRDMDKMVIDPDLYRSSLTFRFLPADLEKVKAIAASLPAHAGGKEADDDDEVEENEAGLVDTRTSKVVATTVTEKADATELMVSVDLEAEVMKAIAAAGISMKTVTHPIPPKYAAMIENLKAGMQNGKQIIFMDEKTQHNKLRRIIASALGLDEGQIGIINATTVSKATGPKLKKVKKPVEPAERADGNYKEGAWEKYYADLARYEDYQSALNDVSLSGMEGIAADYNEGRTPIVICNKKAEVGINLHKGTTDIHHLTFPWTPASISQRNGRGARVGSSQDSVNVHYYCGQGSFDEFRLQTLQRKKDWINQIMTSDVSTYKNGDVDEKDEINLMLAANPEERQARINAQLAARREVERLRAEKEAETALDVYLRASVAAKEDPVVLASRLESAEQKLTAHEAKVEEYRAWVNKEESDYNSWMESHGKRSADIYHAEPRRRARSTLKTAVETLVELKTDVKKARNVLSRSKSASTMVKRARGDLERSIKAGIIDVDPDVLLNPSQYVKTATGTLLKAGAYYWIVGDYRYVGRITRLMPDQGAVEVDVMYAPINANSYRTPGGGVREVLMSKVRDQVDVTESQAIARRRANAGLWPSEVASTLSRAEFIDAVAGNYLRVKGDTWMQYSDAGTLEMFYVAGGLTSDNPERLVYPDSNDEGLKRAMYQFSVNNGIYSVRTMYSAVFGENYSEVLEGYGEQATMADALDIFETARREAEKDSGAILAGASEEEVNSAFFNGVDSAVRFWQGSLSVRKVMTYSKRFSNQTEIRQFISTILDDRIAVKIDEINEAVGRTAKELYAQCERLEGRTALEEVRQLDDMDISGYMNRAQQSRNLMALNLPELVMAGVLVGAYPRQMVNAAMFTSASRVRQLLDSGRYKLKEVKNGGYKPLAASFDEWLGLMAGDLSDTELAALREAEEARKANEAEVFAGQQAVAGEYGYVAITNQQELAGQRKWKNRTFRISFPAGGAHVLIDSSGRATLKAKNVRTMLKEKYGAQFWNFEDDPVAGNEFTQPAWIVPSRFPIEQIHSDIQSLVS